MAYFQVCKDEFTSLFDIDYAGQWTNVSIDELTEGEQQIIHQFHKLAAVPGTELDPDVLLVQAKDGFLQDIYAASLRRGEDSEEGEPGGLAVKLGGNTYPAAIEASERKVGSRTIKEYIILCGELFGTVAFADKDSDAEIKIDNTPTKVTYTRCWVDFSAGGADEWRVPLTLDLTQQPSKQAVLDAIADGSLATLLKPVSGGGGNGSARGMAELGEGQFKVIGLRQVATGNGDRWLIDIDGQGEVWSRGGADRQLFSVETKAKIDAALAAGTLTLKVGNIQEKQTKDGKKIYLDSTFRMPKAEPAAAAAGKPAKATTSSAAVDYDSMPF